METTIFCNLISEVASYHFHIILLVRSESLDPAHTQRESITQVMNNKKQKSLESTVESAYHTFLLRDLRLSYCDG